MIFELRLEEELGLNGWSRGGEECPGVYGAEWWSLIPGPGSQGDGNAVTQTGSSERGAAQEMQSSELGRMSLSCCQCDSRTERGQDSGDRSPLRKGWRVIRCSRQNSCFLHHNCIIGIVADSKVLSTCLALF